MALSGAAMHFMLFEDLETADKELLLNTALLDKWEAKIGSHEFT